MRIRLSVLKNSFGICPRINDLALTLTWTSLLNWRLADILFFLPVGFSFLSCLSFDIFELLQRRALVASAKAINVTVAEVQNGVTRVEGAKAAAGAGATRERNGYRSTPSAKVPTQLDGSGAKENYSECHFLTKSVNTS